MRVSQHHADAWTDHFIATGGKQPAKSSDVVTVAGKCANCERDTPYLFAGFKFENVPAKVVREMDFKTLQAMKASVEVFQTQPKYAEVCLRCRPLSNLEMQEVMNKEARKQGRKK